MYFSFQMVRLGQYVNIDDYVFPYTSGPYFCPSYHTNLHIDLNLHKIINQVHQTVTTGISVRDLVFIFMTMGVGITTNTASIFTHCTFPCTNDSNFIFQETLASRRKCLLRWIELRLSSERLSIWRRKCVKIFRTRQKPTSGFVLHFTHGSA